MSTATSGACSRISRVACNPVSFGIFTSRIARSGRSRIATSRASAPSEASAITSMSSCCSSNIRRPERTIPWSSAIRIFTSSACGGPSITFRYRQDQPDPCAHLRPGFNLKVPADEERALAHAADPEPAAGVVEAEPAPVVGDPQLEPAVPAAEPDPDVVGARVPNGVRERLLGHPVDDELRVARDAPQLAIHLEGRLEALAGDLPHVAGERRLEAEVVERRRAQLAGECEQLLHGPVGERPDLRELS